MKSAFWIFLCAVLAGIVRCHNLQEVFVEGRIYFLDADCYSRMTRAQLILGSPARVLRWHDFENHPIGVDSHTTAPLDYLIIGLKTVLDGASWIAGREKTDVLRAQTLDLAGALISPLLGVATCIWLGVWARIQGRHFHGLNPATAAQSWPWLAGAVPFFAAISPILVHGTAFGRPDHQSLIILLLAIALGAEGRLAKARSRRWATISGFAWAIAAWVSLYEPLILFAVTMGSWAIFAPRRLLDRDRAHGLCVFLVVGAVAFAVEGWRIHMPDPSTLPFLRNWSESIGELKQPRPALLFAWLGWGFLAAPVLLAISSRRDRTAIPMLALLLVALALTCWQLRWGYFAALIFAMSLPSQLAALRKSAVAWLFFAAALWPTLRAWDETLFPNEEAQKRAAEHRLEMTVLRKQLDDVFGGHALRNSRIGFIAPWWLSPAIAYWTGHHGVAGSSHESVSGIVDTARFYLAEDPKEASAILQRRKVGWVLADDPGRVISTSSAILGVTAPNRPLAATLAEHPLEAPAFLVEQRPPGRMPAPNPGGGVAPGFVFGAPRLYRIYLVEGATFPHE